MLLWSLCFAQLLSSALGASGVASGRSSHIFFKENVASHHTHFNHGMHSNAASLEPVKIPVEELTAFFNQYGTYFGVQSDEMRVIRESHNSGSKITNVFHDQYIAGYKVYGGEVVVSLGANNQVVSAQGHALPSTHVDVSMASNFPVSASAAFDIVSGHLTSLQPTASGRSFSCSVDHLAVSTEWYRDRIHRGEEGNISLVHHFSGRCAQSGQEGQFSGQFDAFVDTHSGQVVEFFDKSGQLHLHSKEKKLIRPFVAGKKAPIPSENLITPSDRTVPVRTATTAGRRLDAIADFTVEVYETSFDTAGDPLGCCTGALLYEDDTAAALPTDPTQALAVDYSVGVSRMMRALTNQTSASFLGVPYPLRISVNYPDINAFFDGADITIGSGLEVDDVVAHEWGHGYVQYTSGLQYAAMSGAMNEAFADIIGESYDLLYVDSTLEAVPRSGSADECTDTAWAYAQLSGTDASTRWIIGEEVSPPSDPNTPYAFRDMYVPECFGNPGSTLSELFQCDMAIDYGGVHSNSGIVNRAYALLVDGMDGAPGIGLVKALNLFWAAEQQLTTTSQFVDLAMSLNSNCQLMVSTQLFEPNLTGESSIFADVLTSADCATVDTVIGVTGLMKSFSEVCDTSPTQAPTTAAPTEAPTLRPDGLVCTVEEGVATLDWVGDGYCNYNTAGGDFNSAACDYDGGDCCAETCVDGNSVCGTNGFVCKDPEHTVAPNCTIDTNFATFLWIGDGYCNHNTVGADFNSEGCGWDGGDCCAETCVDGTSVCGTNGFVCKDPEYTIAPDCPIDPNFATFEWIGNGYCDHNTAGADFNSAGCGWDGGDCCAETCVDGTSVCGANGFVCLDPMTESPSAMPTAAQTVAPSAMPTAAQTVAPSAMPTAAQTAAPTAAQTSTPTATVPTAAQTVAPTSTQTAMETSSELPPNCYILENPQWLGDGYCDKEGPYNTAECEWDRGDCCESTCNDGISNCGIAGFDCKDPNIAAAPVHNDGTALCGLVHSTNMHNVANDWTCKGAVPNTPPCGDMQHPPWSGVKCDPETGRVKEVSWQFTDYFVQGHIDSSIRHLTEVTYLDFHHQLLKGPIEPELGNLPKLHYLDLSVNQFTGKLPKTFRNLKDRGADFRVRGNDLDNHQKHH